MSTHFDLDGEHRPLAYKILASLVTPRPIAWVTTLNEDGSINAAPFSFFNVFGSNPPLVALAPGNKEPGIPKDTARNIRRQREFVINLVDASVIDAMAQSAAPLPYGQPELENSNISYTESSHIAVPRIAQAPAALECTEHSTLEIGTNRIVLGIVHRVHTAQDILDPKTANLDQHNYQPIGRMASPSWYCTTEAVFEK